MRLNVSWERDGLAPVLIGNSVDPFFLLKSSLPGVCLHRLRETLHQVKTSYYEDSFKTECTVNIYGRRGDVDSRCCLPRMVLTLLSAPLEKVALTGNLNSGVRIHGSLGTWDVTITGSKAGGVQRGAPSMCCSWG